MTFLNTSLLLLGAGLALGPIIIHLLNRRRYRIIDWAAADFLLESFKKTKRRIRLEQLLLLAMRVAGVGLMGVALARPFVPEQNFAAMLGTQARSDHVVILDDSYSMGQTLGSSTIFARARDAVLQIADRVQPEDTFAVLLTSANVGGASAPRPLFASAHLTDRAAFKRDAAALTPSDFSTDLGPSLQAALDIFSNSSNPEKRLYILTDCRRRDWTDENDRRVRGLLEKLDKKVARAFLMDFGAADAANLSITEFICAEKHVVQNLRARFLATVVNRGSQPALNVPVTFRAGDIALPPRILDRLGPGETTTLDFSYVFRRPGVIAASASLPADALAPDNAAYLALDVRDGVPALIVNGAPDPEPYINETDYLVAALDPGGKGLGGWRPAVITDRELPAAQFDKFDLVVLANVATVPQAKLAELETYVRNGGSIAIFLGDRLDRAFYNAALFKDGAGLLPGKLGVMEGDPNNAEKSFRLKIEPGTHPLQSALGGELAALLAGVHVRAFIPVAADVRRRTASDNEKDRLLTSAATSVLASFSDRANSPALVERRFGNGRVLVFASTASARWHDWPANPSYPVFVQELFSSFSRTPPQERTARVGSPIERAVEPQFIDGSVTMKTPRYPEQPAVRLTPHPVGEQMRVSFADTGRAGVYKLALENGGSQRADRFARNVEPAEGDLAKADPAVVAAALGDAPVKLLSDLATAELDLREQSRGKEFWKYVLIALLAVLVVEQTLARRFTHLA
ncbi:MAG: BatA domain-containing protein [Verrucomicrobia bacterium]|nr:BatA domain-containing protein [Verrucomicrobiota bacterium]